MIEENKEKSPVYLRYRQMPDLLSIKNRFVEKQSGE